MKVGDKIWHFDMNRRVYRETPTGMYAGGPIYRHYWHEVEIKSETSRSWVTNYGKAPKKGDHQGWAFTDAEMEDNVFVNDNAHRTAEAVRKCKDPIPLKQVMKIMAMKGTS